MDNYHCNSGHRMKVIDGRCAECARERQAAQRARNAEGRRLVAALREHGVPLDVDHLVEGHRLQQVLEIARHPVIGAVAPTY